MAGSSCPFTTPASQPQYGIARGDVSDAASTRRRARSAAWGMAGVGPGSEARDRGRGSRQQGSGTGGV